VVRSLLAFLVGTQRPTPVLILRCAQETGVSPRIDLFWLQIFPWEWAGAATNGVQEVPVEGAWPPKIMQIAQPFGNFVISGLHHTVAALARMGHNVVVDHVHAGHL
jgi:hypothetical protein